MKVKDIKIGDLVRITEDSTSEPFIWAQGDLFLENMSRLGWREPSSYKTKNTPEKGTIMIYVGHFKDPTYNQRLHKFYDLNGIMYAISSKSFRFLEKINSIE